MNINIGIGGNNPFDTIGPSYKTDINNKKKEFREKCTSKNTYSNLDEFGNPNFNTMWPVIVMIIGIIITGFIFNKTKFITDVTGIQIENPYIVFISLIIVSALFGIYAIYLYVYKYSPEYNKWLNSLSSECKTLSISLADTQAKQNEQDRLLKERNLNRI